jgi:alkyl sulfatase BDS1-like metallo-beta-lactamase superfamily hydrolase
MGWKRGQAYSQDLRDRAFILWNEGYSVGEIAETLHSLPSGLTRGSVRHGYRRYYGAGRKRTNQQRVRNAITFR